MGFDPSGVTLNLPCLYSLDLSSGMSFKRSALSFLVYKTETCIVHGPGPDMEETLHNLCQPLSSSPAALKEEKEAGEN